MFRRFFNGFGKSAGIPPGAGALNTISALDTARQLMADFRFDAAEALIRAVMEVPEAAHAARHLLFQILAAKEDVAVGIPLGLELLERGDDPAVIAGLAQLYLSDGQMEGAEILVANLPPSAAKTGIRAKIAFARREFPKALELLNDGLAQWPNAPQLTFLRGLTRLIMGDMACGWDDYEARLLPGNPGRRHPFMDLPKWDGGALPGRGRLLIWAEQGVGDEILFSTVLPDAIAAAGAGRCDVSCDPRLAPLFARSFPGARFFPADEAPPEPKSGYVAQISVASLPGLFRRRQDQFPPTGTRLAPDPVRVAAFRQRLSQLGPPPYVGVAWRSLLLGAGRTPHYMTVEELTQGLAGARATLVSLQYGVTPAEQAAARAAANPILEVPGLDLKDDLDGVAALAAALDQVVCVDTALAPLAASCGTQSIWLCLPGRWPMLGRPENPWFPGSITIVRDPQHSWDGPLAQARALIGRKKAGS